MRSCSDVHNFLLEEGVAHEIIHLPALATTAHRAADQLGVAVSDIVKSLVFATENGPVVALVPGDRTANLPRLRAALGCRRLALAGPAEVLDVTGYRPGAVPPCGLALDLPMVADPACFAPEVVYCGGGTTTTMLRIRGEDLRTVLGARVAAIADAPQNGSAAPAAQG
jgi:prolyl-tRNA editing enzyme YbaK/EbsC (Cys-tRNA(Pro) deacylase)